MIVPMATRTEGSSILGQTELEQFHRDGYFVFDPGVGMETIDAIRSDMEDLYSFEGNETYVDRDVTFVTGTRPRIMNSWHIVDSARELALAPRVLGVAEELFGRKPLPFQTLNFMLGTEQPPHMDSMAFYSDPPDYMCGVWVALEDMDMDNGPLVYYPGSHRVVRPTAWEEIGELLGKHIRREDYPDHESFMVDRRQQWHEYCGKLVEMHGLKPAYGTIKKGQALLWAPNLLHGGAPQRDNARTRHSQVTHYFFEGCRHYSPVRTEGDRIFWDYLDWVRDPPITYGIEAVHEAISHHAPSGAKGVVTTHGPEDPLLKLDGFELGQFDAGLTEDEPALAELERVRSEGATFLVIPKPLLWWVENQVPALQHRLEFTHRALLRDGGVCAIYALD
jgi:ectoine hydroxylase-related dioxygenase (phytanoyl-CoA dioxygenase family)